MKEVYYSIDLDTRVFEGIKSALYGSSDLIYFRSTSNTPLDSKSFRKLLSEMFSHLNPFLGGVEVFCIMQKYLSLYPFPNDYIRPLNYPYLEVFSGDQSEIKLPAGYLKEHFPEL